MVIFITHLLQLKMQNSNNNDPRRLLRNLFLVNCGVIRTGLYYLDWAAF